MQNTTKSSPLLLLLAGLPLMGQTPEMAEAAHLTVYYPRTVIQLGGFRPLLLCDGTKLQELRRGTFIDVMLPPGNHMVFIAARSVILQRWERSKDEQYVEFKAGEHYFFRLNRANFDAQSFIRVTEAKADAEMQELTERPALNASCASLER